MDRCLADDLALSGHQQTPLRKQPQGRAANQIISQTVVRSNGMKVLAPSRVALAAFESISLPSGQPESAMRQVARLCVKGSVTHHCCEHAMLRKHARVRRARSRGVPGVRWARGHIGGRGHGRGRGRAASAGTHLCLRQDAGCALAGGPLLMRRSEVVLISRLPGLSSVRRRVPLHAFRCHGLFPCCALCWHSTCASSQRCHRMP